MRSLPSKSLQWRVLCSLILSCGVLACGDDSKTPEPFEPVTPAPDDTLVLSVDTSTAVAEVDPRYLSVAVDASQVAGGVFWGEVDEVTMNGLGEEEVDPYDFSRPKLRNLSRELAPGFIRIGGSEADLLWYDMSEDPVTEAGEGFTEVLNREMWDGVNAYALDVGMEVFFTVNAGPGYRSGEDLTWDPAKTRELMEYTAANNYPVTVWEFGNEINAYPLLHQMLLDGEKYGRDIQLLVALRNELTPEAMVVGPSSAYWPLWGELNPVFPQMIEYAGPHIDAATWHYYPTQSPRCLTQSRLSELETLTSVENLAEFDHQADTAEGILAESGLGLPLWLGETGNAQCGGAPGISDRYAGTLWWVDELGRAARRGQKVIVRQTLSGSDYGLIDERTLEPRPDYYASVLWQRLMGTKVLAADSPSQDVVVYAHCAPASGAATMVVSNFGDEVHVHLDGVPLYTSENRQLSAASLDAKELLLNGEPVAATDEGHVPAFGSNSKTDKYGRLTLPRHSITFVRFAASGVCN